MPKLFLYHKIMNRWLMRYINKITTGDTIIVQTTNMLCKDKGFTPFFASVTSKNKKQLRQTLDETWRKAYWTWNLLLNQAEVCWIVRETHGESKTNLQGSWHVVLSLLCISRYGSDGKICTYVCRKTKRVYVGVKT